MTSNDYWLARWLDEHDIRGVRAAGRILKDKKHIEDLCASLSTAPTMATSLEEADETTIVAGRTIDLSGEMGCYDPKCLENDVDRLFSRVWHYFDIIAVTGLTPEYALYLLTNADDWSRERFLGFVENFFYVRQIGAEDMLLYHPKPHACTHHLRQHAKQLGVTSLLDEREAWVSSFSARAEIDELDRHDDHWHYVVLHPDLPHMANGVLRLRVRKGKTPKDAEVFGAVFDQFAANLVGDVGAAREMRAPLAAVAPIHEAMLSHTPTDPPSVQDAMFELRLPVVSGLTTKDLIKLRRENWQYFHAFSLRLKKAAREFILNAEGGMPPAAVARQIENDIIEPGLIEIRRNLRSSVDTLTYKSAVSLPVSAITTTIGLLDKLPMIAAGATAVIAAGSIGSFLIDYKKYLDDKREVRMEDMYFLWNVQRIADRATHQS